MNKRQIARKLHPRISRLAMFASRLLRSLKFMFTKVGFWRYNYYNFLELILNQNDFIIKYGNLRFYNFGREVLNEMNDKTYSLINGCENVLDLGGYNGDTALFLSRNNKRVFVFEPEKEKFKYIKKNIKLNNCEDKIFPYNYAVVANNKKSLDIYKDSEYDIASTLYSKAPLNKIEHVRCIHIKDVLKLAKFDGMKCDVEGGEWEIIDWMIKNKKLREFKKMIFELHFSKENSNWNKEFKSLLRFLKKEKLTHSWLYCDGGQEIKNIRKEVKKILSGSYPRKSYSIMIYIQN